MIVRPTFLLRRRLRLRLRLRLCLRLCLCLCLCLCLRPSPGLLALSVALLSWGHFHRQNLSSVDENGFAHARPCPPRTVAPGCPGALVRVLPNLLKIEWGVAGTILTGIKVWGCLARAILTGIKVVGVLQ